MATAHLVMILRHDLPIPMMVDVRIFSEPATSLTQDHGLVYAEIIHTKGETFEEAHRSLIQLCERMPHLSWTKFWLFQDAKNLAVNRLLMRGMPGVDNRNTDFQSNVSIRYDNGHPVKYIGGKAIKRLCRCDKASLDMPCHSLLGDHLQYPNPPIPK